MGITKKLIVYYLRKRHFKICPRKFVRIQLWLQPARASSNTQDIYIWVSMSWYKTQNVVLQERAALAQVQKKNTIPSITLSPIPLYQSRISKGWASVWSTDEWNPLTRSATVYQREKSNTYRLSFSSIYTRLSSRSSITLETKKVINYLFRVKEHLAAQAG